MKPPARESIAGRSKDEMASLSASASATASAIATSATTTSGSASSNAPSGIMALPAGTSGSFIPPQALGRTRSQEVPDTGDESAASPSTTPMASAFGEDRNQNTSNDSNNGNSSTTTMGASNAETGVDATNRDRSMNMNMNSSGRNLSWVHTKPRLAQRRSQRVLQQVSMQQKQKARAALASKPSKSMSALPEYAHAYAHPHIGTNHKHHNDESIQPRSVSETGQFSQDQQYDHEHDHPLTSHNSSSNSNSASFISPPDSKLLLNDATMLSMMNYQGMEVVFAVVQQQNSQANNDGVSKAMKTATPSTLLVVDARNYFVIQRIDMKRHPSAPKIVSLTSHPDSGMVVIVQQNGHMTVLAPIPTHAPIHPNAHHHPSNISSSTTPDLNDKASPSSSSPTSVPAMYGRYHWRETCEMDLATIFINESDNDNGRDFWRFTDRRYQRHPSTSPACHAVDVSLSQHSCFLVSHGRQVAVLDALLTINDDIAALPSAKMVWTTLCTSNVRNAKISGDGRSIVVVLEDENSDVIGSTKRTPTFDSNGGNSPDPIELDGSQTTTTQFGCRTFVQDPDDGFAVDVGHHSSSTNALDEDNPAEAAYRSSISVGRVFKPGPFLVHSAPVTRISFRGAVGQTSGNAAHCNDNVSNGTDLLLTYCQEDSSVRIFQQVDWVQCMSWTTPPHTRADFLSGSVAFTLGDLESATSSNRKKYAKRRNGSRPLSRKNSGTTDSTNSVDPTLLGRSPTSGGAGGTIGSTSSNILAAGAWIAELTFRHASFPALRLSRLSYLQRGTVGGASSTGAQAAHFESVAAILPIGSLDPESVLHSDDLGLSIHGIWPAWNPWTSAGAAAGASNKTNDTTLSGSAMAFLGLSGNGVSPGVIGNQNSPMLASNSSAGFGSGLYGNTFASGGTHAPPSELRLFASNPDGQIVTLEFPLWGDEEFGGMELGTPLRHILSLPDAPEMTMLPPVDSKPFASKTAADHGDTQNDSALPVVSLDYESSRLCARIDPQTKRSIQLLWRKAGTMAMYAPEWDPYKMDQGDVLTAHPNVQDPSDPLLLHDVSCTPIPLSLPSLNLPSLPTNQKGTVGAKRFKKHDTLIALAWIQDESFGSPPLLISLLSSGTCVVFEIPPPAFALEPDMPNYDLPSISAANSAASSASGTALRHNNVDGWADQHSTAASEWDDSDDEDDQEDHEDSRPEYEVMVKPHADFGLGLRLESPMDGLPAIAGSFKKHPLNGGMLPAEKTGMIVLGDELMSVNGVSLDNMTFDDIIGTVRHVGAEAGPGEALCLRFRPFQPRHRKSVTPGILAFSDSPGLSPKKSAAHLVPPRKLSEASENPDRRTMEQILGVHSKKNVARSSGHHRRSSDGGNSLISYIQDPPASEIHQEFGRVVLETRTQLPEGFLSDLSSVHDRFIILPQEAATSDACAVSALILMVSGRKIYSKLLTVPLKESLMKGSLEDLGTFELPEREDGNSVIIHTVKAFNQAIADCSRLIVMDTHGEAFLVKVSVSGEETERKANFSMFPLFSTDIDGEHEVRAFSLSLFATRYGLNQIRLWSARPDPSSIQPRAEDPQNEFLGKTYVDEMLQLPHSSSAVVDFAFFNSGHLDAYPCFVVFTQDEALLYQRRGNASRWRCTIRLKYLSSNPGKDNVCQQNLLAMSGSPQDVFPHIASALVSAVSSFDENHFQLSDWNPESLLAHLLTEHQGCEVALQRHVKKVLRWLSERIHDSPMENAMASKLPLYVCPFDDAGGGFLLLDSKQEGKADIHAVHDASSLMASITLSTPDKESKQDEVASLETLRTILGKPRNFRPKDSSARRSREYQLAMASGQASLEASEFARGDSLPPILASLDPNEIQVLWALCDIGINSPAYRSLDPAGQLALTVYHLHKSLVSAPAVDMDRNVTKNPWDAASFRYRRSAESFSSKTKLPTSNASAGCLGALLSNCQGQLVDSMRPAGGKFDWPTVRELQIPLWIRSDDKLKDICEEVGQHSYREGRDIMKSAIYFIAAGKIRTLKNLSAADQTSTGQKFYKFLTNYDFSSEQGRRAAEKNAYSLLRKNQYETAAAFFLLPQPPLLKSAVETIATKLEDLSLAFLIARLVSGTPQNPMAQAMQSLGGFGGGGGYAGFTALTGDKHAEDENKFKDWKPKISKIARELLSERGLPETTNDSCLSAAQLLWLGRKFDASHWLTNLFGSKNDVVASFNPSASLPRIAKRKMKTGEADSVINNVNDVINFVACPFLLKIIGASRKSLLASSLVVASSLTNAGIELPSIRCLVRGFQEIEGDKDAATKSTTGKAKSVNDGLASSSIFDSYDAVPRRDQITSETPQAMTSSIFDDFDVPRPTKPTPVSQVLPKEEARMSSSIFDSYDAPVPPQKAPAEQAAASNGQMSSSIFDNFDVPIQKKALPKPTPATDSGTSSIFDSFDVPAAALKKTQSPPPSGEMTSSIFDSFDAIRAPTKQPVSAPSNGTMSSSIFDQFDNAPPARVSPNSILVPEAGMNPAPTLSAQSPESEWKEVPSTPLTIPLLWMEWYDHMLISIAARRLIRELATISNRFHGDQYHPHLTPFDAEPKYLIPNHASQTLQFECQGDDLMTQSQQSLDGISEVCKVDKLVIGSAAICLLKCQSSTNRLVLLVLVKLALGLSDSVEDDIRSVSSRLIQDCGCLALVNDKLSDTKPTVSHDSTLFCRRRACNWSWQLELCSWMHRSGLFPLTGAALNEMIAAARIGMLIAAWNRDFECLQTMIKYSPDCATDHEAGRQLWTSLKLVSHHEEDEKVTGGSPSGGGWEFLVDCRRAEATKLLKPKQTGCFIIRPHPEDHGVFTLSFKTNLAPTEDVVQHAIVRLSDSGFRCGSFGPFATLMKLLEAVSASLPFNLRFDMPPSQDMLRERHLRPSPNATFFRKFALARGEESMGSSNLEHAKCASQPGKSASANEARDDGHHGATVSKDGRKPATDIKQPFGSFVELLVLSKIRTQLSAVVAATYKDNMLIGDESSDADAMDTNSLGSLSQESYDDKIGAQFATASRMLRPLLNWCRRLELAIVPEVSPDASSMVAPSSSIPIALNASETAIEVTTTTESSPVMDAGDAVIRQMIKRGSGVEFRTIRLGDGANSAMVVLFSKREAINWLVSSGTEKTECDALERLRRMEISRVIEPVDFKKLAPKLYKSEKKSKESGPDKNAGESDQSISGVRNAQGIRYRIVDPWEVEPLRTKEAETKGASIGRHRFLAFGLGHVSSACDAMFRDLGGTHLLELWAACRGGVALTKALASIHAPWERGPGVHLTWANGIVSEPQPYMNSIHQHLYRNVLFRRLGIPQRFIALIQVELMDLKNLTSPSGSLSLTVYSFLRLKRSSGGGSPAKRASSSSGSSLSHKARTLDTVTTSPVRLGKTANAGPNAPPSWGSLTRFRFPLPEYVRTDGSSHCTDREALFKGPPTTLQVSVYEKKFMSDSFLGSADVNLDGLMAGGQLEEWVPLQNESRGIHWFARIRLTLRFELLCLTEPQMEESGDVEAAAEAGNSSEEDESLAPSVGLKRIQQLTDSGGINEDMKKSASTPDLLSYIESMVY